MFSLTALTVLLVVSLVLPAWAVAYAARRSGSPRGRFGVGLLAVLVIGAINLGFLLIASLVPPADASEWVINVALVGLNLLAAFLVLGKAFNLPPRRALVPFGSFVLVNLVLIVAVYLGFRPYVCQAYQSPSIGMAPTVEKGDRFAVNKRAAPRRWDLVVYRSEREGALYCKRLVGLPGERIKFEGGSLKVNDQPIAAPPVLEGKLRMSLPGAGLTTRYQDGEDVALGTGEYFLIGDNIDSSADSRLDGPTAGEALVGVVDLIYWPPRKISVLR
jgi:signal peptidase I